MELQPDPWWFDVPVGVWIVVAIAAVLGILFLSLTIATKRYQDRE